MRPQIFRPLACSVLILSLASCGSTLDQLTRSGACSSFNGDRDSFSLDLNTDKQVLSLGQSFAIPMTASWYNNDLRRETVDCTPSWEISNPSVASINGKTLTGLTSGITKVTAVVAGSAGTKTASFWLAVRPGITEREPNNGYGFAQVLLPGIAIVGDLSPNGDVDYYAADIPPHTSFQFTLVASPTATSADPFPNVYYSGEVISASGEYIGEANRGYTNITDVTKRVYFVVNSGSYGSLFPYSIQLVLN